MSVLKFKKSDLDEASKKIDTMRQGLDGAISNTSEANRSFVSSQSGEWAAGETTASIKIESEARIFNEALDGFKQTFERLTSDAGTIKTDRDEFLSELGASASDPDRVVCDTGGHVTVSCSDVKDKLDGLDKKISAVTDAMSGLEDKGTIPSALDSLKQDVTGEGKKLDDVSAKWQTFSKAASEFESTYSASLKGDKFITEEITTKVGKQLEQEWGASAEGQINTLLHNTKDALGNDFVKLILGAAKKYGEGVPKTGAYVSTALWAWIKGHASSDELGAARGDLEASIIYALGKSGEKGSYLSQISEKFKDSLNLGKSAKEAWDDIRGALGKKSFAGETKNMVGGLSRAGKFASGVAKGVGVVGDALSIYGIFSDSKQAYETTAGDGAQKTAAAIVTAGGGVAKFGIGKAVGAVVGTAFGGPVGTVVGIGVGMAVDKGIGWVGDKLKESGAQKAVTNWVAGGIRRIGSALGGGSPENAFA